MQNRKRGDSGCLAQAGRARSPDWRRAAGAGLAFAKVAQAL